MPVKQVRGGQTASFALKKVRKINRTRGFNQATRVRGLELISNRSLLNVLADKAIPDSEGHGIGVTAAESYRLLGVRR